MGPSPTVFVFFYIKKSYLLYSLEFLSHISVLFFSLLGTLHFGSVIEKCPIDMYWSHNLSLYNEDDDS